MFNKSMNFTRRLNREKTVFFKLVLKFGGLLGVWKLRKSIRFQIHISKITQARQKKDVGCEYHNSESFCKFLSV